MPELHALIEIVANAHALALVLSFLQDTHKWACRPIMSNVLIREEDATEPPCKKRKSEIQSTILDSPAIDLERKANASSFLTYNTSLSNALGRSSSAISVNVQGYQIYEQFSHEQTAFNATSHLQGVEFGADGQATNLSRSGPSSESLNPSGSQSTAPGLTTDLIPTTQHPEARTIGYPLYVSAWLKQNEKTWPLPEEKKIVWDEQILPDIEEEDLRHSYCLSDKRGGEIFPVAVGLIDIEEITRYFVCVCTQAENTKYFKRLLKRCRLDRLHPNCLVHFAKKKLADGPIKSMFRSLLHYRSAKTEAADATYPKTELPEAPVERLSCGQRLYGYRNETASFSVTLGGFVLISEIPFIVTAGHLLEYDEGCYPCNATENRLEDCGIYTGKPVDGENAINHDQLGLEQYEFETWDPNGDGSSEDDEEVSLDRDRPLSEVPSKGESSSMPGSFDGQHAEPNNGRLVFRLSRNPNASVIGIECFNAFKYNGSRSSLRFCDDWCLLLPADDATILNNIFYDDEQPDGDHSVIKIKKVVPLKDVYNKAVTIFTKPKTIRGVVSSPAVALKLPGDKTFSKTWRVILDRPITYGDSGSWIIDDEDNFIGQLTAGIVGDSVAYFIPATELILGLTNAFPGLEVDILRNSSVKKTTKHLRKLLLERAKGSDSLVISAEELKAVKDHLRAEESKAGKEQMSRQAHLMPKPYAIDIELFTTDSKFGNGSVEEYGKELSATSKHLCQGLIPQKKVHLEFNGEEACSREGYTASVRESGEHLLLILPQSSELPVFMKREYADTPDALSVGQTIGFGSPHFMLGKCIHKLYTMDAGGSLPNPSCGAIFRYLLGDTPHITPASYSAPDHQDGNCESGCLLTLSLPLLLGLAALQTDEQHWVTELPQYAKWVGPRLMSEDAYSHRLVYPRKTPLASLKYIHAPFF